jgi:hypothetical protein
MRTQRRDKIFHLLEGLEGKMRELDGLWRVEASERFEHEGETGRFGFLMISEEIKELVSLFSVARSRLTIELARYYSSNHTEEEHDTENEHSLN